LEKNGAQFDFICFQFLHSFWNFFSSFYWPFDAKYIFRVYYYSNIPLPEQSSSVTEVVNHPDAVFNEGTVENDVDATASAADTEFVSFLRNTSSPSLLLQTIDYGCEDGHFPVSATSTAISNHHLLSTSETKVNSGRRSSKIIFQNELILRKPLMVEYNLRSS
jgi:hypothetical protein